MTQHLFLPKIDLDSVELKPEHEIWLKRWLEGLVSAIDECNVASSICLQGLLTEIVLYGNPQRNWLEVFEDCLTDENGYPLAYSESYGQRLYKFSDQWRQTAIHAIHSRWYTETFFNGQSDEKYAQMIKDYIQPNGWIYNPSVSSVRLRNRMKSEYLMSFAMGLEILKSHNQLEPYKERFEATLSSQPLTPYLSAECFRLEALEVLNSVNLIPEGLDGVLPICEAGEGYCDFSMSEKRDEYMGTEKRSSRDIAVHSPLSAVHAQYVAGFCHETTQESVKTRLINFARHLDRNPLDIPAFKIRDLVDIPFGTDISPIEVIAASSIINKYGS